MIIKWRVPVVKRHFCWPFLFMKVGQFRKNHLPSEANLKKEKKNGLIIEALPDATFKVQLEDGREVFAYLAGKMRMNYIKVMIGDRVTLELSPDGNKGRIIYRN